MSHLRLPDDVELASPDGSEVLAAGAVAQLRAMHDRLEAAVARAEERRPFLERLRRGWRRARRNGARLHLYPAAFRRGYNARHDSALATIDTKTLSELVTARKYDEAMALAAALLPKRSADLQFLRTAQEVFALGGALTWQIVAVRMRRAASRDPKLDHTEAKLVGKLRELNTTWLPLIRSPNLQHVAVPGRVLHLLKASMPYRQSGYTMRSQYVIASQRAVGLDPVAVTAPGFPEDVGAPPSESVHGTCFHRIAAPRHVLRGPADAYVKAYAEAVAERMADIRPEVIHAHSGHRGYESALVAHAVGRAFSVPVVYEVRGFFESLWTSNTDWSERGETYALRYARETWCMNNAAAVVTLSESMKTEIVTHGIPSEKILVVPNGVDTEQFYPKTRSPELVERWSLSGQFVFGYVSNLDHPREGHELLIKAVIQLRSRGVPAVVMIVGDGRLRAALEHFAREHGATDAVRFTGRVPHSEVLDYYRLLDVFVVPRIDERAARLVTPLKPFEAMAAEVPVVVSDLAALQEIVGGGKRGRSFETGNVNSLSNVLAELHADPAARATLARRARRWVETERQWLSNGRRYADLYDRVTRARAV